MGPLLLIPFQLIRMWSRGPCGSVLRGDRASVWFYLSPRGRLPLGAWLPCCEDAPSGSRAPELSLHPETWNSGCINHETGRAPPPSLPMVPASQHCQTGTDWPPGALVKFLTHRSHEPEKGVVHTSKSWGRLMHMYNNWNIFYQYSQLILFHQK